MMRFDLTRRAVISSATAGLAAAAIAKPAFAQASTDETRYFGPAAGVAKLSQNENPYGPAPSALKAIYDTATAGCYYANAASDRLTAMIAERFGLTTQQVVVSTGSAEVLSGLAIYYGSKGNIIVPELFFEPTVAYAERLGTKVVRVPLKANMDIDLDAMAAAITPETSLVQITNPNNPTGIVQDGDTLRRFIKKVGPKVTVLIDEAYMELVDRPEYSSVADMVKAGDNVIVTRTFSKIYGMAGMRVGYALGNPEVMKKARTYLMSYFNNSAGLAAAIASYNDAAFLAYSKQIVADARGMIMTAVKSAGLTALPSQANFVYVKVPDADAFSKAMAAKDILVRGSYGKWTQYSRVSTGKIEDVKRYVAALPGALEA